MGGVSFQATFERLLGGIVRLELFDAGGQIGVSCEREDYPRHAERTDFSPGWEMRILLQFHDWLELKHG